MRFDALKIFGLAVCVSAGLCSNIFAQDSLDQTKTNSSINFNQTEIDGFRRKGFAFLKSGNWSEATKIFEEILRKSNNDPLSLYGNALALFNLKRVNEAEGFVNSAVELLTLSKDNSGLLADSLVLSSIISAASARNGEAIEKLLRATKLDPEHFDANFALGRALFGNGNITSAVEAFRNAVKIQPEHLLARFFLATALERDGLFTQALKEYRAAVKINADYAEGNLGLGVLLLKIEGDSSAEGILALQKALSLNGNMYEGRISLGRAFNRTNRAAEAVEHLQIAAKLAPDNPEPHYQLALAYRKMGKQRESADEMEIVRKIHQARRGAN
jgi:tetratricopeptide (TPR) repeat protein